MPSFLLLAGLGSYLVVGLLCVAAFAIAGVAAYFYLRAKNREALDPAKGLVTGEAPAALGEMRELTSRIEEIVTTQQDHGETQRAHLSRKIDQMRESVESQHHAVTGLRHELRHEIDRRDSEMHEMRHQIAAVREGLALPPAEFKALPPSAGALGAPETDAEMTPISFSEAEEATFTEVPAEEPPAPEALAFDEVAFAPLDAGPEEAAPAGLAFAFEEDEQPLAEGTGFSFEDVAFGSAPDAPTFEDAPDPLDPAASPAFAFEEAAFEAPPPVFSFEEDDSPAEPSAVEAASAPEPPAFTFEEDEPPAQAPFSFEEEPVADPSPVEPAPEAPVFSFEEDEAPTEAPGPEPAEAFQVVSFLEPDDAPAPPAFSFEEDDSPAELSAAEAASAPPVFAFEEDAAFEDEPVAAAPEPVAAPAQFVFEEAAPAARAMPAAEDESADETPAEAPKALAFEEEEMSMTGHVAMEAAQASVAGVRFEAPTAPSPAPTFAPPLTDPSGEGGAAPAWIARADRQPPEAPVETIGGIAVERVGDVPSAAPSFAPPAPAEPAADLPPVEAASAPEPAPTPQPAPVVFEDEFPTPVVASELVVESLDFGFDVDAELAAAGQVPLDEDPAPASEPIRHAPVPPLRMEVPSPTAPAAEASHEPAPTEPAPRVEAEPEEEVEAYVPPEGAEDLTVISSVDTDTMRALHMTGVLTLDEIARWGRSDARRVASSVGVAEETIMHQWIFEAQSALFERYSRR